MEARASIALAPGFRFLPSDQELTSYYLRQKICEPHIQHEVISETDVYKYEPWDLPVQSMLKTREQEWYFFTTLDRKYDHGLGTNRVTRLGYWEETGRDQEIWVGDRIVGMKRSLVFHTGLPPLGDLTDWIMHEYRLVDEEVARAGFAMDLFVLCKIFLKRNLGPENIGPSNGGEWDEEMLFPIRKDGDDTSFGVGSEGFGKQNDDVQKFFLAMPEENAVLPMRFDDNDLQGPNDLESPTEGFNDLEGPKDLLHEDEQRFSMDASRNHGLPEQPNDTNINIIPEYYQMGLVAVDQNAANLELDYFMNPIIADNHVGEDFNVEQLYFNAPNEQPAINDEEDNPQENLPDHVYHNNNLIDEEQIFFNDPQDEQIFFDDNLQGQELVNFLMDVDNFIDFDEVNPVGLEIDNNDDGYQSDHSTITQELEIDNNIDGYQSDRSTITQELNLPPIQSPRINGGENAIAIDGNQEVNQHAADAQGRLDH